MTEARDAKVSAAYRALGAQEPPRALDDAILAAARRSARPWTQRWALPVSIAAVVVLSVTVTLRIQHERPGIEAPEAAPQVAEPKAAAQAQAEAEAKPALAQQVPPRPRVETPIQTGDSAALRDRQGVRAKQEAEAFPAASPPAAPMPAPETLRAESPPGRADAARTAESNVAGVLARPAEERGARDAASAARAPQAGPVQALAKRADIAPTAKLAAEPPERELERIAELRKEGKHDEADKALAEFRKRHPDFRLSDAQRERVEKR